MTKTAKVFEIKRFAVHDGPGIRTAIFLKGCPLRCRWCHNPEGIGTRPQLAYYKHKCIGCEECVKACPDNAHRFVNGAHVFEREKCTGCGVCENVCLGSALKLFGRELDVKDAYATVLEDRDFYKDGGGCTVSGGEPLMQAEFCAELFKELKKAGIHCAIDTSGAVPWSRFETVLPYTDIFLYDVKHIDSRIHEQHTGFSNEQIMSNLGRLSKTGIPIEIRIPVIPGFNANRQTFENIGDLLSGLSNITVIKLLPFHALARSKYDAIGYTDTIPIEESPSSEMMNTFSEMLTELGLEVCS